MRRRSLSAGAVPGTDAANLQRHLRFADVMMVVLANGKINELQVGLDDTPSTLFPRHPAAKTRRPPEERGIEAGKSGGGIRCGFARPACTALPACRWGSQRQVLSILHSHDGARLPAQNLHVQIHCITVAWAATMRHQFDSSLGGRPMATINVETAGRRRGGPPQEARLVEQPLSGGRGAPHPEIAPPTTTWRRSAPRSWRRRTGYGKRPEGRKQTPAEVLIREDRDYSHRDAL